MIVQGHRPILAMEVAIDTVFFRCAQAFPRSRLWKPETWRPDVLPSFACLVKDVTPTVTETVEELEALLPPGELREDPVPANPVTAYGAGGTGTGTTVRPSMPVKSFGLHV
jgi:hypothetical protein